jgi:hypothetical protein
MGLLECVMVGEIAGQETVNRWNYLFSGTAATNGFSFGLANAMGFILSGSPLVPPPGTIFFEIIAAISAGWSASEVIIRDVYNPLDFVDIPYIPLYPATNGGTPVLSPFTSYGFKTNRTRLDIRRGTKRLAGVTAADVDDDGVVNSTQLARLVTLAGYMSDTLSFVDGGNTANYEPCIVQKEVTVDTDGKKHVHYYGTLAAQVPDHVMTGVTWTPYPDVRSQVSRQYGKGS